MRERIYDMAKSLGYRFPNVLSPSAYISPYAKLGCGCVVLNNVVVQNGSRTDRQSEMAYCLIRVWRFTMIVRLVITT